MMGTTTRSFCAGTSSCWPAGTGGRCANRNRNLSPHPGAYPAIPIILTPIREDSRIFRSQSITCMELEWCYRLNATPPSESPQHHLPYQFLQLKEEGLNGDWLRHCKYLSQRNIHRSRCHFMIETHCDHQNQEKCSLKCVQM